MRYTVEFSRHAARALRKLPHAIQDNIKIRLRELEVNPRPLDAVKMKGYDRAFRIREGDYRIVYEVHDRVLLVLVLRVGHRKEVYRDM